MSVTTIDIPQHTEQVSAEDAAGQLYSLLEEHFDELGLDVPQRDVRYSAALKRVTSEDGEPATAAASD